ncbi:hypothetical protein [Nocardia sp. Marseille-Q1738]
MTTWEGELENREPEKCSGLEWFAIDALPDHMIGCCRTAMQRIADGTVFSVYGWWR